ncbi:hypothetical protein JHK82_024796 [Glycine max]|nr:hypothetical protein JHK86_024911 [Glycine max]KAG5133608.1 hypothetical protein JHK82_024796 [Glycine max]
MTSARNKHPLPPAVHFVKIILTTSLADGILLPKKFTRKYGDGMSNPVFLKPADGTEWKIHYTKHGGEIWFQKGWKEFATYYSLDHGHLLFFEYEGTSHFDVHIFDSSALEIDYPSHGTHEGKDNLVEISDDSVEILGEQFSCQNTRGSSPQPCKKMKNSITTNVERSPNVVNLHQHVPTISNSSQKATFMKQMLDEDDGIGIFNTEYPKVEQSTSTALKKASTFRSEHPFFRLVMKPSFINGYYLEIPPQFAERYLKKTHAIVILEILDGRTWSVICSATRLTEGWQKFASENNLNVGDVCVFELIQKIQGLCFKVSIYQGAEEPICPISQGGTSSQRSSQVKSRSKLKILTIRYIALKRASKFTSENPFFMVTLTTKLKSIITRDVVSDEDIYDLMQHVPMDFVRKHLVNVKQKLMMIHFRKKLWPVRFVVRESSTVSGNLSTGWAWFVRENELQRGDVCIFELFNREDATFDAHVFRGHREVMH